jgi:DNA-binding transcriptional regulator GbsR (MarR family)
MINDKSEVTNNFELDSFANEFIMHFGEMGNAWGINRTVGQIYALLYLSPKPLNADDISEITKFSRSNVSMGLKELQSWNLIKLKYHPGDRKEYFSTPDDIWQIFRTLAVERKKRELDPTLSMLRNSLLQTPSNSNEKHTHKKIKEMHDFMEIMSCWFDDVNKMNSDTLMKIMKMGSKIQKFINKAKNLGAKND